MAAHPCLRAVFAEDDDAAKKRVPHHTDIHTGRRVSTVQRFENVQHTSSRTVEPICRNQCRLSIPTGAQWHINRPSRFCILSFLMSLGS